VSWRCSRLRLAKDATPPISVAAADAAHGQVRRARGYSASMLIEESRVFHVATFCTYISIEIGLS